MNLSMTVASGPRPIKPGIISCLRDRFQQEAGVMRVVGTHSVLSAQLAATAGFDGVWASSLEISTLMGVCDDGLESGALVADVAQHIAANVSIPVILDCQVPHADLGHVKSCMQKLSQGRIAGVCLQDSLYPCPNSLLSKAHPLAPTHEFCRTLCTVRQSLRPDVLVLARVQAFIAGTGLADALNRARAYSDAGAHGIVVHSRRQRPDEVMSFLNRWDRPTPLVLIPTTYHGITVHEIAATGKVGMIIYSNHGLRAAIAGMERVFNQIRRDQTAHHAEEWITPLSRVFELQDEAQLDNRDPDW